MLLRSPFGLPLIKRIFIPISIPRALCAEGTAGRTSSSSLRSWLLCVACDTVSLMFSIAHLNICCIVILVKSEKNTYSVVLRHIYHNHIRSDLFDILIRNRILRIAAKQAFPVFAADARHNNFLDHAAALIAESTASPPFGPIPLTVISFLNISRSSFVRKPYRQKASSLT